MMMRDPKDLSKRAVEVLRHLRDHEHDEDGSGELVCDGLECWYGLNRTNRRVVNQLLECCFVSSEIGGGSDLYVINESGRRFLEGQPPYRDSEGKMHKTMFTMLNLSPPSP
jgi:hypothetical protein